MREARPSGSGPRPPAGSAVNTIARGHVRRWRPGVATFAAAALVAGAWLAAVPSGAAAGVVTAQDPASICPGANVAAFGPDVCVFNTTMSQATIQGDLNAIAIQQVPVASQFDSQRYTIFFQPGTYGSASDPLVFQVGYYTEVAGLGAMPQDTVIDGAIDVFNNLCTAGTSDCNSDDNFWRSLSNLTLNVDLPSSAPAYAPPVVDAYGAGCANSEESWSASQADPIRRAIINGSVVFQDYCAADDYASGGFIADSKVSGDLDFYGNQQYMVRNSEIGGANGCPNGLWNMVYSGVTGRAGAGLHRAVPAEHGPSHEPGDRGGAVPVHGRPGRLPRVRSGRPARFVRPVLGQRYRSRHVPAALEVLRGHPEHVALRHRPRTGLWPGPHPHPRRL